MNAGRAEVRAVIERAEERRRAAGRADDLLPRRDPPLQQGAAGRAAARGRGGAPDPDRGDDREPVLRGQLGAALSRTQLYELRPLSPEHIRAACSIGRWPTPSAGSRTRREVADEALELLAGRSGGDARIALSALERAVETAARRGPRGRPRRRRGRAPAQGAHLRPRGRPPLRLHLRLDQGDPRLRPRRLALLPGGDARGRRGPAVHRPADGDPRLRGHRQRRPPGARGRERRRRRRGPGRAARVPPQPRAGGRLPGAGAEVERLLPRHPAGQRPRPRARRASRRRPTCATPTTRGAEARPRGRLRLPARRARRASPASG